jgi:hypothetical protein
MSERTRVRTLSQKRLEIQALRCNGDTSGRCSHRRHHGILQLRFQLDSDVCSADLHHNPRKHVGLHAHQRLYQGTKVPWYQKNGTIVVLEYHWYHTNGTYLGTMVRGDAGAGARAVPHACEDCGGDPRCRHRCRVGTSTVVYRDAFYADNAHLCPSCT